MRKILFILGLMSMFAHAGLKEGKIAYSQKNYEAAFKEFLPLAESGNPAIQNQIAFMYDNGRGVSEDKTKAFEWYLKAAQQNHTNAQYNLGTMYLFGYGVTKDKKQAATWFEKAASQGNADAQTSLAVMYTTGEGVVQDNAKAIDLYRKAASQGSEIAQFNLGSAYCNKGAYLYHPEVCYAILSLSIPKDSSSLAKAALNLDMKEMTATQIDAGKKLAIEMSKPNNYLTALDAFVNSHQVVKKN